MGVQRTKISLLCTAAAAGVVLARAAGRSVQFESSGETSHTVTSTQTFQIYNSTCHESEEKLPVTLTSAIVN